MIKIDMVDFVSSDFATLTGGVTTLILAILLDSCITDPVNLDEESDGAAHSIILQIFANEVLWLGWYGFNPGNFLTGTDGAAHSETLKDPQHLHPLARNVSLRQLDRPAQQGHTMHYPCFSSRPCLQGRVNPKMWYQIRG